MAHAPDPAPVLDLITAFRSSAVLFSAVSLGVFDRLASGPADAPTLARFLGAHPDALMARMGSVVKNPIEKHGYLETLSKQAVTRFESEIDRRIRRVLG